MTEGKRRVVCEKCNHSMCYLCGKPWTMEDNKKHDCALRG